MANKFSRVVVDGADYEAKKIEGAELARKVAKAAYGVGAGNVMIERTFDAPITSRDGVSNIEQLHVSDPIPNMVIQTIVKASKRTNQHAGDGTTATAILASDLFIDGIREMHEKKLSPLKVSKQIIETSREVSKHVESMKLKAAKKDLRNIANISSGDQNIGKMISYIFEEFKGDGGVVVATHDGDETTMTVEDGFYFKKGLTDISFANNPALRESHLFDTPILVSNKVLKTSNDLIALFEKIGVYAEQTKRVPFEFLLVADVESDALTGLLQNDKRYLVPTVVAPPEHGGLKEAFLQDIATYTGARVVVGNEFEVNWLGHAEEVVVSPYTTNIIGGAPQEDIAKSVDDLQKQLKGTTDSGDVLFIKSRIDRLLGKIGTISVGGETEEIRIERKLRIDDAVNAVRSAKLYGILPGEATALLSASDKVVGAKVYGNLFRYLLQNCGYDTYGKLADKAVSAKGKGYDIENGSTELIDLREAGIVDPLQVVLETVKNAAAVAALLVTSTTGMYFEERDTKLD